MSRAEEDVSADRDLVRSGRGSAARGAQHVNELGASADRRAGSMTTTGDRIARELGRAGRVSRHRRRFLVCRGPACRDVGQVAVCALHANTDLTRFESFQIADYL